MWLLEALLGHEAVPGGLVSQHWFFQFHELLVFSQPSFALVLLFCIAGTI